MAGEKHGKDAGTSQHSLLVDMVYICVYVTVQRFILTFDVFCVGDFGTILPPK